VKWLGWASEEATCEPLENLAQCDEILEDYHRDLQDAPCKAPGLKKNPKCKADAWLDQVEPPPPRRRRGRPREFP
jgi:hypothetical protein